MKDQIITNSTKVEISFLCAVIGGLVWLLTHILPVEARVAKNEERITNLEAKVDVILANTNYIKGKLDQKGEDK